MSISQAVRLIFKEAFDPYKLTVYAPEDQVTNKDHSNISVEETEAVPIHENVPSLVQSEIEVLLILEPAENTPQQRDILWRNFRRTIVHSDMKAKIESYLEQPLKHVTLNRIFAEIEGNAYHYTGSLAVTYFLDPETLNPTT